MLFFWQTEFRQAIFFLNCSCKYIFISAETGNKLPSRAQKPQNFRLRRSFYSFKYKGAYTKIYVHRP